MTYFHFTHVYHAATIIDAEVITTTDSMTDMWKPHKDTDVVWLLDIDDATGASHGLSVPIFNTPAELTKTRVRFEVDVPAVKWIDSRWYKRTDPEWLAIMIEAGGGIEAAQHWYVWDKPIKADQWVSVVDTQRPFGQRHLRRKEA